MDLNARFELKYFKDKVLIILSWFWHFVHLMSSSPDISLLWICKSERIPINFAPPICPIVIGFKYLPASFIVMFCIPCTCPVSIVVDGDLLCTQRDAEAVPFKRQNLVQELHGLCSKIKRENCKLEGYFYFLHLIYYAVTKVPAVHFSEA